MELDVGDLEPFVGRVVALPPVIEPLLTPVEEVVLLASGSARSALEEALRAVPAGSGGDVHDIVERLSVRGLVEAKGRNWAPTTVARVRDRHRRLIAIIRRAAVPEGQDAELLVLAVAAQVLDLHRDEHLAARRRIASLGRQQPVPSIAQGLMARLGVESGPRLAEALPPAKLDVGPFPVVSNNIGIGPIS